MHESIEYFRRAYDLQLLTDLTTEEDGTKPCLCNDGDGCPRHDNMIKVYSLGEKGDRSVGINRWEATKEFKSLDDLDAWLTRNKKEFEEALYRLYGLEGNNMDPDWDSFEKEVSALP